MKPIAFLYLGAVIVAEVVTVFFAPVFGVIFDAILVLILLIHFNRSDQSAATSFLPALALVPLLRILSLTMPSPFIDTAYWPIAVGVPLLVGLGLFARATGASIVPRLPGARSLPFLLAASLTGVPLGLLAYQVLSASPVAAFIPLPDTLTSLIIVLVFTGVVEELLFRGAILFALETVFGAWAVVLSGVLYGVMCLGVLSPGGVILLGISGLIGAWSAQRTRSLWGAVALRALFLGSLYAAPLLAATGTGQMLGIGAERGVLTLSALAAGLVIGAFFLRNLGGVTQAPAAAAGASGPEEIIGMG